MAHKATMATSRKGQSHTMRNQVAHGLTFPKFGEEREEAVRH